MAGPDTKTTILDAAETLLADRGYDATSLRDLTRAAGVNLAAVNYHFGGKEQLATAVLARRIGPINQERRRRLDALPARPTIADVVRAFVAPVFPPPATGTLPPAAAANLPTGVAPGADFSRLFGRMMIDQPGFLRRFLAEQFHELGRRFAATLQRILPRHDDATLWWRLHFMAGAMAHTLHSGDGLAHLTDGRCDARDAPVAIEQLVAFVAAGIAAPPPPRGAAPTRRAASRRSPRPPSRARR
jgi:AcrR family transcriptional regulator